MSVWRVLLTALLVAILRSPSAHGQPVKMPVSDDEAIRIDAQEIAYDQKTDTVTATGDVVIRRGEIQLTADRVRVRRETNEAEASGQVTLTSPEGAIFADTMRLNLNEETGFLGAARIEAASGQYSLSGAQVSKGHGHSFHIEDGRFTTCRCASGPPSWSIRAADLRVTRSGYGWLKGGTFNVLDVPILYLPRAVFPVERNRQSGLLLPRFGASNQRGFQAVLPLYWAIDKSQDATLAFDIETAARVGLVGEYRYALSRAARGSLDASYFNERFRGVTPTKPFEQNVPQHRWSVAAQHRQTVGSGTQVYADAFVVSDALFLRDINTYAVEHRRDIAIRTLPFTRSRAGVVHQWDRFLLKGESSYYQDLAGTDGITLQRVPEVTLVGQRRIGRYVLGDLTATAVDFQRGHGVDGIRLDVQPGAMVPLPLGRWGFGALRVSARETAYHLTEAGLTRHGPDLPTNQTRELFMVGGEIGTMLSRIYPARWRGLEKVKHTIEPAISYLYVPAVAQGDLPLFDGEDRINHRNLVTYGVVSRFIGRFAEGSGGGDTRSRATPIRELGRISLMQSYDFSRKIHPLRLAHPADHFSDFDLAGRINPSRAFSLRFNTYYDAGGNDISGARVGFFVEDPRARAVDSSRLQTVTSAGVSYRVLTGNLLQEIDSNVVLRLTDWAGFLYSSRYDVTADRFLDTFFGLRLTSKCDCWALDVAVTNRTNPHEVEVRAQLTLVGLGSSASKRRVAEAP